MNNNLLRNLETIYSDYLIKNAGLTGYNNIINSHGSILAFLQETGTRKGLFKGLLSAPIFDSECIETEVIGSLLPNGDLVGPYNTEIKNYEKPFVPQSFGAKIIIDDTYITYGIVDQLKAVIQYYGENELDKDGNRVLDYLIAYEENGDKVDFNNIEFRNDEYCLDARIRGKYSGNAGTFEGDSASQQNTSEYDISIKQPATNENNEIKIRNNTIYTNTSRFKTRQKDVRPEYKNNHELTKQEIETLIALKQGVTYSNSLGHEIRLEIPERHPIDNFRNLQTVYENLEKPFIDYNRKQPIKNHLFCEVLGEAANEYYNKGQPARKVDYKILNKYGWTVLTPNLGWNLIVNQLSQKERYFLTGCTGGAIFRNTEEPLLSKINNPIPAGRINVNGNEGIITFGPSRAHKLHKCEEINCLNYGGYYKIDHKHKALPSVKKTH